MIYDGAGSYSTFPDHGCVPMVGFATWLGPTKRKAGRFTYSGRQSGTLRLPLPGFDKKLKNRTISPVERPEN
jgi:hypothetical protein